MQSLKYRSKKTSEETYGAWTSLTPAVSGSSFLFEDDEFGDFASEYAWDVEFYVEDKLTNDNEFAVIVGGKPLVSFRKEKVGINNPNPTAALDVIGDIKQNGNLLADFIVEQGTSGIWTYHKWASGFVEQFGNFNYQNAEIRTASGSIYYAPSKQPPDYAIPFVNPPFVSYSLLCADDGFSSAAWISVDPNDTDTAAVNLRPSPFYLNAATARTLGHPFISIMAFGRWK